MDQEFRVYVVDDDLPILELMREVLADECAVECFASAEACLARVAEAKPNLFVVDVLMPGLDGYALCRRLKDDWDTENIPVVFMSASDDIETRLQCYGAGGDDFIVKPFLPAEVRLKVAVARRLFVAKQALHEQAGYAQRTALSAMTSMGELGVVLAFLRQSFACRTAAEVAEALLAAMRQYDLRAAVQVHGEGRSLSLSDNGRDVPLEVSVLNHVGSAGRIFQFKSRCVFNYGRVTLLVNNMPLSDAERCGRIRDNAALLAEGADARLQAIEVETLAQRRRAGIEEALPQVQRTLAAVEDNYRRNCFAQTDAMICFQESLTKSFVSLGLTESQEESLSAMAAGFTQRMVGTQDESLEIVGSLQELAKSLEGLLSR